MNEEWKAYKSRPQDPDSWEWEVSAGNIVIASRLNEANAERIVKTVNCHDDLYEALKGLNPCQRPLNNAEIPFEWSVSEKSMLAVRKALARAEGK